MAIKKKGPKGGERETSDKFTGTETSTGSLKVSCSSYYVRSWRPSEPNFAIEQLQILTIGGFGSISAKVESSTSWNEDRGLIFHPGPNRVAYHLLTKGPESSTRRMVTIKKKRPERKRTKNLRQIHSNRNKYREPQSLLLQLLYPMQ